MRPKQQAIRSASTDRPNWTEGRQLPAYSAKPSTPGDPCPAPLLQTTGPGGTGADTDRTLQAPRPPCLPSSPPEEELQLSRAADYATSATAGLAILLLASQNLPMLFVLCWFIHLSSWQGLEFPGRARPGQARPGAFGSSHPVPLGRNLGFLRVFFFEDIALCPPPEAPSWSQLGLYNRETPESIHALPLGPQSARRRQAWPRGQ